VLSEGSVLISTTGAPKVGVSGARPQDVLRCDGVFGAVASCNWSMYLDGSTVGLSTSDENVDALFELGGAPYLSTKGPFSVPGLSGDNSDVARCDPDSSGAPIHCASFTTFFDGSSSGLADDLDAAHFSPDAFADPNPAEFRVVILGASTAAGVGASSPAASWAGLLDAWLGTVTASHQMINLAVGNLTTESSRADGSMPPVPDPNHNITRALELTPDLIILNFGASDVAQGIPIATSIAYYQEMKAAADLLGIPLFLTTTQPRNLTLAKRTVLRDEAIAVRATFGAIVIDIYDELADSNDLRLKTIYDSGDGKHPNDAGHNYLFETVRVKIATLVPP
jgi:lysophospholipase L1-like esterase